jgi:predicted hydrocarbon binding protein
VESLCFGMSGMIHGTLDWLGIDANVAVAEEQCIASGADQCEFRIAAGE